MSQRAFLRSALVITTAVTALLGGVAASASAPGTGQHPGNARCTRPAVSGDRTVDVTFRRTTYPVLVYIPKSLNRTGRVPLVLNLHGSSANGAIQMDISGLRAVAEDEGFIVAAPNGAIPLPRDPLPPGGSWAWNVPGVPTTAGQFPPPDARDDIQFLSRTIDVLSAQLCTDLARTYATGHSGGARMTSALGCYLSNRIAAMAPNSGLRAGRPDPDDVSVPEIEDCRPQRPVPVVTFHGQQDVVNPYLGSPDLRWGYAVAIAVQTWARLDGCRRGPNAQVISEHVTLLTYTRCDRRAEVHFYRISNGGHTWPGASEPAASQAGPGLTTQEINASRILWNFFERYRLTGT
jgi:polyhydroxybutyrate depolymerase